MKYQPRDPLAWINAELAELEARGLLRQLSTHAGPPDARLVVEGRQLVNFASNDYLGLVADERLRQAAQLAANAEGWGAGASPLVTGHKTAHQQLERRLAEFMGAERALVFSSGYVANLGTICALVGPQDQVFSDAHNHASIIDGCRLSRARVHVYAHGDTDALKTLLRDNPAGRRLIVSESLFSMGGDLAPLIELVELAEEFNCMLMIDEAHALGVFGAQGQGVAEQRGVAQRIDVRVATLSKALGSAGGFVCGSRSLVEWLVNRARPYVFSTASPAANCAAALAALEIVEREPDRRATLMAQAAQLRKTLVEQGWQIGSSASQIIPLDVGPPQAALAMAHKLHSHGLLVPAMRPPSTPTGRSLLRISLTAGHTPEMTKQLAGALASLQSYRG